MMRVERRRKPRVQLTRPIVARFGATPSVVLDITDAGARIEHFAGLEVGRRARFRLEWRDKKVEVDATVITCRVHRFAPTTVYQSGLSFSDYVGDAAGALRDLVSTHVARSLAEQVANARGIGPVTERTMPVFRAGVVEHAADRGYLRCTLAGNRWERKWTSSPDQPDNGFTVLSSEPPDNIEQLCEQYERSSASDREFIRTLAKVSVERASEMPEPR